MGNNPSEDETFEWALEGQLPTPEQRTKLRRDTLRFARLLPPGAERNQLRWVARSLTFFEEGPTSNPVREKARPARALVANVELMRRWKFGL
jgi:hypothetical protein